MRTVMKLGVAGVVGWAAGCVPLSEHRALEQRFAEQEQYVVQHKDQVRELERREQVVTLRSREQERQLELLRARLEKSETLRQRLAEHQRPQPAESVPASAPREEAPAAPTVAGLEVNPETHGLVLESSLLFPSGRWELRTEGKAALDRVVAKLNEPAFHERVIRVDGHTDDDPIQRSKEHNQDNWELSSKRALAVLHYLEEKGIDAGRLCFAGFGQHRPFATGTDNAAKARNRRVEIVVLER
jgi:flagellar motor protein MotB